MSREKKDLISKIVTGVFSSFGIIILIAIVTFIVSKGYKSLNFKFLSGDYNQTSYNVSLKDPELKKEFAKPDEEMFFSSIWGVGFIDKNEKVYVCYVDPESPLRNLNLLDNNKYVSIEEGYSISKSSMTNEENAYITSFSKDGAEQMAYKFDKATVINNMIMESGGGGIRGSLITTLILIALTLIIALPFGIGAAIYLNEYAKENKITSIIRGMIDLIGGVPSIIFGFVGMLIFIPFMNSAINSDGGSIASGALTMAIILLPTIIKTTEEALKTVPDSYRKASLALGASKTQTIFKVVLPNAINGILTAVVLSIGRIIGESAALIYAIGTSIKDTISVNERSTTLAVHIWSIMSGENPNYEQACGIAIIILFMVLLLSVLIKIINKKLNKFEVVK